MNRSQAVMSQRSEPHDSFDYFPTPVWATRALLCAACALFYAYSVAFAA